MANEELDAMLEETDKSGQLEQEPEFGDEEQEADEEIVEETVAEETESVTDEPDDEAEPQLAKLFGEEQKRVPLADHVKLRKRAQEAEAQRDALLQQKQEISQTNVLQELNALVPEDEDDYVDTEKLRTVVQKLPAVIQEISTQAVVAAFGEVASNNFLEKVKADEIAFKKDHPDFDQVIEFANSMNLIPDEAKTRMRNSPNVAEAYYKEAMQRIDKFKSVIGTAPSSKPQQQVNNQPPPTEQVDTDEEFANDDEAFEAMMMKPK